MRRQGAIFKTKFYPVSARERLIILKPFDREGDAFRWIINISNMQERGFAGIRGERVIRVIRRHPGKYHAMYVGLRGRKEFASLQIPADELI